MSLSIAGSQCTLYIWPSQWGLPSTDPACLAAVLYLQLTMPGKYQIRECSNTDMSPTGQLPFLTHEHVFKTGLPSIISFANSLSKVSNVVDIDASLGPSDRARCIAWNIHVESNMGDLVSYIFYSLDTNYWQLTRSNLVSILPVPQRYYVPDRIRELYRPRLQAAGLWGLLRIEPEKKTTPFGRQLRNVDDEKEQFAYAFEKDRTLEKARSSLDLYVRLLADKDFMITDRPISLDVYLAAHILLLLDPPFPNPLIQDLLKESYPSLVNHARRLQSLAGSAPITQITKITSSPFSIVSLIPTPKRPERVAKVDRNDIQYQRRTWAWVALAIGISALYVVRFQNRLAFLRRSGLVEADEDLEEEDEEEVLTEEYEAEADNE